MSEWNEYELNVIDSKESVWRDEKRDVKFSWQMKGTDLVFHPLFLFPCHSVKVTASCTKTLPCHSIPGSFNTFRIKWHGDAFEPIYSSSFIFQKSKNDRQPCNNSSLREREREGGRGRDCERVSTSIFGTLYSTTEESGKSERRLIVPLKQGTTCPKIPSDDEKWVVIYFTRMIYERAQMILLSFPKNLERRLPGANFFPVDSRMLKWTKESGRLRADLESKKKIVSGKKTTDYDHGERVVIKKVTHDHSN